MFDERNKRADGKYKDKAAFILITDSLFIYFLFIHSFIMYSFTIIILFYQCDLCDAGYRIHTRTFTQSCKRK